MLCHIYKLHGLLDCMWENRPIDVMVLLLLAHLTPDCQIFLFWSYVDVSQCSLMKKKLLNEKRPDKDEILWPVVCRRSCWLVIIYQNSKCNTHSLGVSRISGNVISKNLQWYLACWEMITTPHNIELVLRWLKWVSKLNTTTEAMGKRKKNKRIIVSALKGSTSILSLLFGWPRREESNFLFWLNLLKVSSKFKISEVFTSIANGIEILLCLIPYMVLCCC